MESAYFTPEIEEIHIGYECEINSKFESRGFEWTKLSLIGNSIKAIIEDPEKIKRIRVPYLTKEQIDAEGWKYHQTIPDSIFSKSYVEYYKDIEWFKVVISISETSHYLTIEKVFQNVQAGNGLQEFRNTMYNGECKDINTFRKICKLLRI